MNTENTLFKQGDITVTTSRFLVGSQTFAIRNITSVRMDEVKPTTTNPGVWLLLGALLLIYGAVTFNVLPAIFGIAALALAFFDWKRISKASYSVVLTTSGGEVQAYSSEDARHIRGIVKGINDAIVALA